MSVEIEAKIKVESLDAVAERLAELDAELVGGYLQRDTFFADADKELIKQGKGLRIRQQIRGSETTNILTFKGPKDNSELKSRVEKEVVVEDFASMAGILESLGYEKVFVIEKRRSVWYFGGCEVCLDELPLLGSFVEVEGPGETERFEVLQRLGLCGSDHIDEGYAKLARKKLSELGCDERQLLFGETK